MVQRTPSVVLAGDCVRLADGTTVVVKRACETQTEGLWYCTTHRETFRSNLDKDFHVDAHKNATKTCKLAWTCSQHGLETP